MQKWLLPEYIDDILPPEAARVEHLRRRLLDLFAAHGYELVMPPLVEYLDSLLTGTGHDLGLRTFKLVDQLSGRTLGLRADITPQAARIDAHLLNRRGVTRLCYSGSVLHAVPSGLMRTREPVQIGAEIYGHAGLESDLEIQSLMLRGLSAAEVEGVHLDIGHVAVFRSIVRHAQIGAELEAELFRALQAKDVPALEALTRGLGRGAGEALLQLPELYGDAGVLERARKVLPALPELAAALDTLDALGRRLATEVGELCFDLAELRGYHYHSGVVFSAYARGGTDAIARGGRYDEVGAAFGLARPATGFSIDLRELAAIAGAGAGAPRKRVLAPYQPGDTRLQAEIRRLREAGMAVVVDLPGHEDDRAELACEAQLLQRNGSWTLEPFAANVTESRFSGLKD
jgi:ATP phosphoribosyltransferase regulatory subunit